VRVRPSPLVCKDAVELVSAYVEGTLPRRDRRRLERHLANCDACSAYLNQIRATIAATGGVDPESLDPEVMDGLVELFHQFKDDDQGPAV